MDSLTHGLLGLALAALPLERAAGAGQRKTALSAVIAVSVLAAELPDLDYLLPSADPVLHTLAAHRGYTHSLLGAPVVALVAAASVKAVLRSAKLAVLYAHALLSVVVAHLLPDLWTGWGTRLFLPFSDRRLALDWTMVLDPWVTLPLLAAAVWSFFRRAHFRRAMAGAAVVLGGYLALRIGISAQLTAVVKAAYPEARSVHVFPTLLAVTRWRYVAQLPGEYAVGSASVGEAPLEAARHPTPRVDALPARAHRARTVREALAWARFPLIRVGPPGASTQRIEIADLRYHLNGAPTLRFILDVEPDGGVTTATLYRGASAREMFERFRQEPTPPKAR